MDMPLLHANGNAASREPATRPPRLAETRKLYLALISATALSDLLDANILCWSNGFTMLPNQHPESGAFKFFDAKATTHDCGGWPAYTFSLSEVLGLVAHHAPDLSLQMLRYPNGQWSLSWAQGAQPPQIDDTVFDAAFLPIAAMAALLEALIERQKAQQ